MRNCLAQSLQEGVKALVAIGQDLSELCELKSVEELRLVHADSSFFSNSVSTLRGSYGSSTGQCLIRVLTLVCSVLLVNFRIQWL